MNNLKPGIIRGTDRMYVRCHNGRLIRVTPKRQTKEQLDEWLETYKNTYEGVKDEKEEKQKKEGYKQ